MIQDQLKSELNKPEGFQSDKRYQDYPEVQDGNLDVVRDTYKETWRNRIKNLHRIIQKIQKLQSILNQNQTNKIKDQVTEIDRQFKNNMRFLDGSFYISIKEIYREFHKGYSDFIQKLELSGFAILNKSQTEKKGITLSNFLTK